MTKIKIFFLLLFFTIFIPNLTYALSFDKNYLLSDSDLYSCNLKTTAAVQRFLESENSYLATYEGNGDKASEIIANAYNENRISTCWILTTLQKEQSLITSREPRSERALNFAMGFACPSGGTCDERYSGFKKQVESAAWQIRNRYLIYPELYSFQVGKEMETEDNQIVSPRNIATAVNYNYTPVVGDGVTRGGNYNFVASWQKWLSWFSTVHPAGNLLQAGGFKAIYLTVYNEEEERVEKMQITNWAVFLARGYSASQIIKVDQSEIDSYRNSELKITYPNGTLVRGSGPAIHAIENNRRRHIASLEVLKALGYSWGEVRKISDQELASIPGGEALRDASKKLDGTLIRTKTNPAIYILEEGRRRHIAEWNVFKANGYSWDKVRIISEEEMATYPGGKLMVLNDGLLVKSPDRPGIWISEAGKLRAVSNINTFNNLGYKWSWVKTVSSKFLDSMLKGEPLI